MIGIIIGVVTSIVVFSFFGKDDRAVREQKQKKKQEQQKKSAQIQKMKEQQQKRLSDPQFIKRRQQINNKMKEKLFKGLDPKERQMLQEYLNTGRKQGKSDNQIIKSATGQATMIMCFSFVMIAGMILCLIILFKGDAEGIQKGTNQFFIGLKKVVGAIYPKFIEGQSNINTFQEL